MKKILFISLIGLCFVLSACSRQLTSNTLYLDAIKYIDSNITTIINASFSRTSANGHWFVDGYGFTSLKDVYVDFEDGHYLYRALLKCDIVENKLNSCKALAIFEKQKQWVVIEGEDTQKNNPIIYKWAKDNFTR